MREKILNVPNLRFPKYNSCWALESFLSISIVKARIGWQGLKQEEFMETGEYYLITGTDFKNNHIDFKKCKYVSKDRYEQDKNIQIKNNDILITKDGSIGKVALVENMDKPATLNAGIYVIRLKKDTINLKYLYHYLKAPFLLDFAEKTSTGGTIKHLNQNVLGEFSVPYPDIYEQSKIALFLDKIDARIEVQNKIIEDLELQKKHIIDTLVDVHAPKYKFESLYDFAREGGTPSTQKDEFYENGSIPFIKIDDLSEKYLTQHTDNITEIGLNNSSAWLVPKNSIIYSNGATIGKISINTYTIATKQGILGIVPSKIVMTEYLYYFMISTYFKRQVHRITTKGTMECVYLKDLNGIDCFIPPIQKQIKTIALLQALDRRVQIEKDILAAYKKEKAYLLTEMFI